MIFWITTIPEAIFDAGGTSDPDVIFGTAGAEVIKGLNGNDVIYSAGGADYISGGLGNDTITLAAGAQTVLYRYESDATQADLWQATDGRDTIDGFELGTDRLVLIDISEDGDPINNFAEFIADSGKPSVWFTRNSDNTKFTGLKIEFSSPNGNKVLTISFSDGSQIDYGTVSGVDSLGIFSDLSYLDDVFGGLIDFTTPDDLPASLDVL